jgi:GNAT superfamily N-acetyltransferase
LTWRVRRAGADDLQSLVALGRANQLLHARLDPRIRPAGPTELGARYAFLLDHGCVLVAEDEDGAAFGLCAGRVEGPGDAATGAILDAFVARSRRRLGALSAMLEPLLAWFEARGVERLAVEWVAANAVSSAAWPALGFEPHYVSGRAELAEVRRRLGARRRG